jgi:hypothetical protein
MMPKLCSGLRCTASGSSMEAVGKKRDEKGKKQSVYV